METEPNTENVLYMDEFPELKKRVWLRRLSQQRAVGNVALMSEHRSKIIEFPIQESDEGA